MTDNGVSKKVCIVTLSINTIGMLAASNPQLIPYAIVTIGVICVCFKIVQGFIDWSKNGKEEKGNSPDVQ